MSNNLSKEELEKVNSQNLDEYSKKYQIPKTEIIRQICDMFLDKIKNSKELISKLENEAINFGDLKCIDVDETIDGKFILEVDEAESYELEGMLVYMFYEKGIITKVFTSW